MRTRPRRIIPDRQLYRLARRLLRNNPADADTPVIVSTVKGKSYSSVGRLLERKPGRVSVRVDHPMDLERAVTLFLPENAYLAKVVNCRAEGKRFVVDLAVKQRHTVGSDAGE